MKLETAGEKENKIMHRRELLYKVVDSKVTQSRKPLSLKALNTLLEKEIQLSKYMFTTV